MSKKGQKILLVVGARPNFVKIAPLYREIEQTEGLQAIIVHTGQHFSPAMSKVFFDDLELPQPQINLNCRSTGNRLEHIARIEKAFEPVLLAEQPALVLVVGDVNSTLAAAKAANRLHIPLAHVEAGLRSFDSTMPEELNRIEVDRLANLLFTTEESATTNLINENIPESKIFFCGNVMIDALLGSIGKAEKIEQPFPFINKPFILATFHRPVNVDVIENLTKVIGLLKSVSRLMPVCFPMHPRTAESLQKFKMEKQIREIENLHILKAQGYLSFLSLMLRTHAVLTDSGGIQEETTFLRKTCFTFRKSTERPLTIQSGSNLLVDLDKFDYFVKQLPELILKENLHYSLPPLWDGNAAKRIVKIIQNYV